MPRSVELEMVGRFIDKYGRPPTSSELMNMVLASEADADAGAPVVEGGEAGYTAQGPVDESIQRGLEELGREETVRRDDLLDEETLARQLDVALGHIAKAWDEGLAAGIEVCKPGMHDGWEPQLPENPYTLDGEVTGE